MSLVLSGNATKVTLDASNAANLISAFTAALVARGWTAKGAFACTATFTTNPTNGQQVNIGRQYTFVTVGGDADQNVTIGGTLATTLATLVSNINANNPNYSATASSPRITITLRASKVASILLAQTSPVNFVPKVGFNGNAYLSAPDNNGKIFGLLIGSAQNKGAGSLGGEDDVLLVPVSSEWVNDNTLDPAVVARHDIAFPLRTNIGETRVGIFTPWGFSTMLTGDSTTKGCSVQFFMPYQNPDLKLAGHVPTSISKANPAVVTQTGACKSIATGGLGYANGHTVWVGQTTMKSALGRHTITVIDDDHYSLTGVDTTGDPTYVSAIVANDTLGEIGQCHLFCADTNYGNAASINSSFRKNLGPRNASDNQFFVTVNNHAYSQATNNVGNVSLAQIVLARDAGYVQSLLRGTLFYNGRAPNIEPLVAWGITVSTDETWMGVLPDCFVTGWPLTADRTFPDIPVFTALGTNKKGHNFTSNWTGDATGPQIPGSLVLIYDNG